jgi:LEA14-like dessication related protein
MSITAETIPVKNIFFCIYADAITIINAGAYCTQNKILKGNAPHSFSVKINRFVQSIKAYWCFKASSAQFTFQ